MMPADHLAILKWFPLEPEGAPVLPHGLRFIGLGRFHDDGPEWPDGAHSIECRFATPPSEGPGTSEARVAFLREDAPHHRLHPGRHFELFDGTRRAATVEVLW